MNAVDLLSIDLNSSMVIAPEEVAPAVVSFLFRGRIDELFLWFADKLPDLPHGALATRNA